MSTIQDHHLYNIHILAIIPRGVVDAFDPCFLTLFRACRLLSLTPPTLRYFYLLESGHRLWCREQAHYIYPFWGTPVTPYAFHR